MSDFIKLTSFTGSKVIMADRHDICWIEELHEGETSVRGRRSEGGEGAFTFTAIVTESPEEVRKLMDDQAEAERRSWAKI